ncbi:hypothetical protein F2P79_017508 [Pimephales promelas]|nr:hypothetical protein F2P79_017508 [Pimephales promelas]
MGSTRGLCENQPCPGQYRDVGCGGQGQQLIRLDMTGERGKREERTTAQQRTDINDLALLRDQP